MAEDADILPEQFVKAGVDIVYVHPEGERTVNSTLQKIARLGAHPGIAVDSGLSLEAVKYMLPAVDYVLIMTVNPGFAGQKYLDYVTSKIAEFAAVKVEYGFKIFVDGACSPEVIKRLANLVQMGPFWARALCSARTRAMLSCFRSCTLHANLLIC